MLSIDYPMWRFLFWQKNATLTYDQIDDKVAKREIVPNDEQVRDLLEEPEDE